MTIRTKPPHMGLNDLALEIHALAIDKGWYHDCNSRKHVAGGLPGQAMMIVAELGEAMQELRSGNMERYREELVDVLIRLLDFMVASGILDIYTGVMAKHEINKTRPVRHGKVF